MPLTRTTEPIREFPKSSFPDSLRQLTRFSSAPKEVLAVRGDEIAVICHELRNSLAIVRGAARLLRQSGNAPSGNSADAAALIERHAGQMSRHIDDLLHPLRRNGHDHGTQFARLDLRSIAGHAAAAVSPEMRSRGHRLVVKLPEEPVWTQADGARLEQAFLNLLINAARYTADGGDIALIMERANTHVLVRVRDSGIGIDPAMLKRVFGMFVQIRAAPALNGREHGIGLAVVRNLVEQHGGTVSAASAGLGRGSEFTIDLPVRIEQGDALIIAAT
jgi:signal transduction histidine kinase